MLPRVHFNIAAAARRRVRQIRNNCRIFIRTSSTLLRQVAMSRVDVLAEQAAICAEHQASVNLTNAAALSFELRLQDLERTLDRVTYNVYRMLRSLNDWKNDVNPYNLSDELLELRAATRGHSSQC